MSNYLTFSDVFDELDSNFCRLKQETNEHYTITEYSVSIINTCRSIKVLESKSSIHITFVIYHKDDDSNRCNDRNRCNESRNEEAMLTIVSDSTSTVKARKVSIDDLISYIRDRLTFDNTRSWDCNLPCIIYRNVMQVSAIKYGFIHNINENYVGPARTVDVEEDGFVNMECNYIDPELVSNWTVIDPLKGKNV
jgi:hypothetical protein